MIRDAERQRQRKARMAKGLPASIEVGELAEMMSVLGKATERFLGHEIQAALFTTPHLAALYREDIEDTFTYVGLTSLENPNPLYHILRDTSAVEAASGVGMCKHPEDHDACVEEMRQMPYTYVLTILYTPNALSVEVSQMSSAYSYMAGATNPTSFDFELGADARKHSNNEEDYWEAVKDRVSKGARPAGWGRNVKKMFFSGDAIDENSREEVARHSNRCLGLLASYISVRAGLCRSTRRVRVRTTRWNDKMALIQ